MRLVHAPSVVTLVLSVGLLYACNDDSSSTSTPAGSDAGATADASSGSSSGGSSSGSSGSSGDDGGSSGGPVDCNGPFPSYILQSSALFATTGDLKLSKLIATVRAPGGATLTQPIYTAKGGSGELIVSAGNCRLCLVDPSKVASGNVEAELLKNDITPVALGDGADPGHVLVATTASGGYLFQHFDISAKTLKDGSKIAFDGSGVTCTGLQDVEGHVRPNDGTYDLYVLTKCTDGATPLSSAFIHVSGIFSQTPPFTSTQTKHNLVAYSKNSASNYDITRMKADLQIFGAVQQMFHVGGQADFVLDNPSPFKQCTMAGTQVAAPAPF